MTHTKGPWVADLSGPRIMCGDALIVSVWNVGKVDQERIGGESWLDMRNRIAPELRASEATAEANAHLIAAAPDMLEALKQVLDAYILTRIQIGDELIERSPLAVMSRAAIAKAEGKQ